MGFLETYFVDPIVYNTGYNIVNTLAFAVILIIAVFGVFHLLKKMKIKIDRNFLFGVIPFVAMGGIMRAWEDLLEATNSIPAVFSAFSITDAFGVQRNLLLVSPFIYFFIFVIALASLLIAKTADRKMPYWKTWFSIGLIIDIAVVSQLRFADAFALGVMIALTAFWIAVLWGARFVSIRKNLKIKHFFSGENTFLLNVHLFDATTTFTALSYYPYFEQHVLPSFLIGIFGPWIMFPLKLIVVSLVLYVFDREMKKPQEEEKRTFLKLIILILGLGPGLRNFLRIVMGV